VKAQTKKCENDALKKTLAEKFVSNSAKIYLWLKGRGE
jgi:hypothetical protein